MQEILIHATTEFVKLFGELLFLFVGVSFVVALLQIYVSPEKIKNLLSTPIKPVNSILGASLGVVTPFCSCSTIPILNGLIKSGVPFCGVISFLLTSPVLNPAIITLFIAFFGIKATIIYSAFVLSLSIIMGLTLDKFGFEKEIKNVAKTACGCAKKFTKFSSLKCGCSKNISETEISTKKCCCSKNISKEKNLNKHIENIKNAAKNSKELFKNVFPYLLIGAVIGAFIHEVIPEDLFANFSGVNNFLAIPIAALVGIPMYIRTETMIPVASILMTKGVSAGVVIALIIGGAGASLPELSLLSSIFKKKMIFAFVGCVFFVAIITGIMFNIIL